MAPLLRTALSPADSSSHVRGSSSSISYARKRTCGHQRCAMSARVIPGERQPSHHKSSRIRTYKIIPLKPAWNEHLQKSRVGAGPARVPAVAANIMANPSDSYVWQTLSANPMESHSCAKNRGSSRERPRRERLPPESHGIRSSRENQSRLRNSETAYTFSRIPSADCSL
jgi:hypothetical protein